MNQDLYRPRATFRGRLLTLCWVLFALLTLLTVAPARWGWTGWPLVLNLVSFPLAGGLALGAVAVAFGVGTVSRRSQDRPVRVVVALLLVVVAAFQVATVVRRGGWWANNATRQSGDLVVVSFNSAGQEPLPGELAEIIGQWRPQVVSLPEMRPEIAEQLAAQVAEQGLDYQVLSQPVRTDVSVTSLLVSTSLGTYAKDREGSDRAAAVRAVPEDGDGPVVIAVHPESPQLLGRNAVSWQAAGRQAVAQCSDTPAPSSPATSTPPSTIRSSAISATAGTPRRRSVGRAGHLAGVAARDAGQPDRPRVGGQQPLAGHRFRDHPGRSKRPPVGDLDDPGALSA